MAEVVPIRSTCYNVAVKNTKGESAVPTSRHKRLRHAHEVCVYCGSRHKVTREHVPPRNLFPPPRPSNMITVPACLKCNHAGAKDDEYFRQAVCLSAAVGDNPAAGANRQVIMRALHRPTAPGLKTAFLSSIRPIDIRTSAGLWLRRARAYNVDLERLHSVVGRWVRGLFYYETQSVLPAEVEVLVHSNDTLRDKPPDVVDQLTRTLLVPLSNLPSNRIGDRVFEYRFQTFPEDQFTSAWALTFFERVSFVAITTSGLPNEPPATLSS